MEGLIILFFFFIVIRYLKAVPVLIEKPLSCVHAYEAQQTRLKSAWYVYVCFAYCEEIFRVLLFRHFRCSSSTTLMNFERGGSRQLGETGGGGGERKTDARRPGERKRRK